MLRLISSYREQIYVHLKKSFIFGHYTFKRCMTTGSVEHNWILRLNKQVNYKRSFYSPEKVEVIIPTIPYQAFGMYQSGTMIKPWSLVDLVASVLHFTQNQVGHGSDPNDSIVDNHLLQEDNLIFVTFFKMNINRGLHNPGSPKFPLTAEAEVTHASDSSTRCLYTVGHPGSHTPYITCTVDEVLVNKVSRRTATFPYWWKQKYSHLTRSKERIEHPMDISWSFLSRREVHIEFEHIDQNSHTAVRAYLKFCMNAAFKTVVTESHDCYLSIRHLRAGVKCIQMFFHRESNYGDILIVEMFENKSKVNAVYFKIKKRDFKQKKEKECCSAIIEFYE